MHEIWIVMAIDSDEKAAEHSMMIIIIKYHSCMIVQCKYNYTLQTVYFLFLLGRGWSYLLFSTVSKAPFSACVSLMGVMAKLPWLVLLPPSLLCRQEMLCYWFSGYFACGKLIRPWLHSGYRSQYLLKTKFTHAGKPCSYSYSSIDLFLLWDLANLFLVLSSFW